MPTTKPRITITLEPHSHEVLSRLSAASGDSMSQIVAGFVDLAVPSLERVVVVMERARAAPEEVRSGLAAAIERADRALMPALTAALDQTDLFLSDVTLSTHPAPAAAPDAPAQPGRRGSQRGAPAQPGRGAKPRGDGASTPRPVTRGVGSGKTRLISVKGGR